MEPSQAIAIDLVEAAYDLEVAPADWLPNLLEVGESMFDLGCGHYGAICAGASESGVPIFTQLHAGARAEELPLKVMRAAREAGPDVVGAFSQAVTGHVAVLSELKDRYPRAYEVLTRSVGCKDMLSLVATDPDAHGVNITIPSPELIRLTGRQREYWQMIGVHLTAGHRLRRGLSEQGDVAGRPITEMPLRAEALLDPKRFLVTQATGGAQDAEAAETIREAARFVDKARGSLRKSDPEEALRLWEGLVRGRWSLVDWFDTDGRRFVLAKPNVPNIGDPRGLTEREAQVATYAAHGESGKLIGYRLGLSNASISRALDSAMHKLAVKTQAQLVEKMRGLPDADTFGTHPLSQKKEE
ncbi:MAG: helix-turn-helix transcriptional regulator [Deltaproteobacteria bacterium]|nr:helix-turn-helix transcriptional regulator [Deltaproteobacteria bacterium]